MSQANAEKRSLAGQVAVVTGSTQGIGGGIALKLAEQGARILVHGRDSQRAGGEKIVEAIEAAGSQALLVTGDLRDESHCRSIVRNALSRFGRVDILVNNAGVVHRGTIEDTSTELWDEIFDVNLRAPFLLCQEAVRHMKDRQERLHRQHRLRERLLRVEAAAALFRLQGRADDVYQESGELPDEIPYSREPDQSRLGADRRRAPPASRCSRARVRIGWRTR